MIEHIERLTPEDKLFMILNSFSFTPSTKSTIDFYRSSWMGEIDKKLSHQAFEQGEIAVSKSWDSVMNLLSKKLNADEKMVSDTIRVFRTIKGMPSETKEQISEILNYFNSLQMKFLHDHEFRKSNAQYICDAITVFYKTVLACKMGAHEVMVRCNMDVLPADENQYQFFCHELRHLFTEFMEAKTLNYSAVVIYMIITYLNNEKTALYQVLVNSKCALNNFDKVELSRLVVELLDGEISALKLIDSIDEDHCTKWTSEIIEKSKTCLTKNYEKNKICDRVRHGGLVIGDDVLSHNVELNELVIELDKLSKDTIKDYCGEITPINYVISKRQVGYLKVYEKLPVTKVLMPNGNFFTLTKYDGESYLLFNKEDNSGEFYGISFPCGNGGVRKIISFSIPDELDYEFEI
jgi:hypothetical protein